MEKAKIQAKRFIERIYREGLSEEYADIDIIEILIDLAKKRSI